MSVPRAFPVAAVGLMLATIAAGCGVDAEEAGAPARKVEAPRQTVTTPTIQQLQARERQAIERRRAALPDPVANTVVVAGPEPLGIGSPVRRRFGSRGGVAVRHRRVSDRIAFRDLCTGRADIVETDRQMSEAEIQLCVRNGIEPLANPESRRVQPIQLAAEGIVVATKNEADVGGDCLRRTTVRDIFRDGSEIDNWNQVGFDDIPLTTTGREEDSDVFQLFGTLALGAQSEIKRADLRDDFRERDTDDAVRFEVTGAEREDALRRASRTRLRRQLREARRERERARRQAEARAVRGVLAAIERENAALRRSKRRLSEAQKDAIERRNRRRVEDAKRVFRERADRAVVTRITRAEQQRLTAAIRDEAGPGRVGFFRFTYYELYEDQLRPIEIWDPVISQAVLEGRGVATTRSRAQSDQAIAARRTEGGVSTTARSVAADTPTDPGSTYVTNTGRKVVVPPGGPVDVDRAPSCIFPSRRTIASGVYPFSTRLLAYTTAVRARRQEVRSYLGYWLEDGQDIVADRRLIPLDDSVASQQFQFLTGRRSNRATSGSGAGTRTGSTSATPARTTSTTPAAGTTPAPGTGTTPAPATGPDAGSVPGVGAGVQPGGG